jgi:glycosyltransferase involved in cell wall biosynthesis
MRQWERRDGRVRYLRTARNSGAPAGTRNFGVAHARGDWVAFLDDDDEWLEGKLASQLAAAAREDADVVAANALRSDGDTYFSGMSPVWRPTRLDLLNANPIIMSSVLIRRELLLSSGGFPTPRWTTGIDDYALWLELMSRGARFVILGEALVRYEDAAENRLSRARARAQLGVTRLAWSHALRAPVTTSGIKAALLSSASVGYVLGAQLLSSLRIGWGHAVALLRRSPA